MMGYRASMFMIFFNYGMIIANWIGTYIFPTDTPQVATAGIPILGGIEVFQAFSSMNTIITLLLTAGVLALFAFSLLIPTIPFVFMFFGLSAIITNVYIWQLPLPTVFLLPISMGITIVYYVGITQYASRSTFMGS